MRTLTKDGVIAATENLLVLTGIRYGMTSASSSTATPAFDVRGSQTVGIFVHRSSRNRGARSAHMPLACRLLRSPAGSHN
ncbi:MULTISPECIES: hypothetical protein [Rhodococcus]|uniref:hypothetical protein n=1 Tax=Rhodococcus TaxID=1827 RepID=UPI0011AE869B|nr:MULTISPECIES: hypothetical protein [Rhodococcus]MDC3729168.1 hypothetical protein [Rhodococcus sp. Rp3]WSE25329.1 hypothetical protein U9J23_24710 [Rhodococcus sp. PD04]